MKTEYEHNHQVAHLLSSYGSWKNSVTTWDAGIHPVNSEINYQLTVGVLWISEPSVFSSNWSTTPKVEHPDSPLHQETILSGPRSQDPWCASCTVPQVGNAMGNRAGHILIYVFFNYPHGQRMSKDHHPSDSWNFSLRSITKWVRFYTLAC